MNVQCTLNDLNLYDFIYKMYDIYIYIYVYYISHYNLYMLIFVDLDG